MKKEEFLELIKAGLSDCGAEEEQRDALAEYAERAVENLSEDHMEKITALDAHKLALSMFENGETAVDDFISQADETTDAQQDQPSDEEAAFDPDQFFYEFASIEGEPEFVSPVFDDETVAFAGAIDDSDLENDVFINSRKLNRAEKLRGRKSIDKSAKGTPKFWGLFIVTLPVTLPIFALIWAIVGLLYAAVSAVIAVLIAAMVAVVGIGTALALVGLIFGIIKCFSVLPIGLYEVGVAVTIAGVTMLVSVLIYNLAVRFVPKLYSLINRFAGWIWHSIQTLYYFCKKECDK